MTIAILYDDDGRITNRFYDHHDGEEWTNTDDDDWPEDESGEDEVPRYYYDEDTGEIAVEYEQIDE